MKRPKRVSCNGRAPRFYVRLTSRASVGGEGGMTLAPAATRPRVAVNKNDELSVTIEDRGGGVAEEFVGSLFERFTRGATRSSEGVGLGLSIAQSYARAHGGTLTYEPAKPHGARFRLILPAAVVSLRRR